MHLLAELHLYPLQKLTMLPQIANQQGRRHPIPVSLPLSLDLDALTS